MLLSHSVTGFLLQEDLSYALRRHLFIGTRIMRAGDERKANFPLWGAYRFRRLREAAPDGIGHHIFEPASLIDGADFHSTHQLFRQFHGRLHKSIILELWIYGFVEAYYSGLSNDAGSEAGL